MTQEPSHFEKLPFEVVKPIHGQYQLFLMEGNEIVDSRQSKNIVLITGRQLNADLLFGLNTGSFRYVAVGSDSTTPTINDIGLNSEIFRGQYSAISRLGLTVNCSVTFGLTEANGVLAEIGTCSSNVGGSFYNRATFLPMTKLSTQTLLIVSKFFA